MKVYKSAVKSPLEGFRGGLITGNNYLCVPSYLFYAPNRGLGLIHLYFERPAVLSIQQRSGPVVRCALFLRDAGHPGDGLHRGLVLSQIKFNPYRQVIGGSLSIFGNIILRRVIYGGTAVNELIKELVTHRDMVDDIIIIYGSRLIAV